MHLSRWKKSAVIGTTAVVAAGLLTATIMGAQGAPSAQRAGASGHVTHADLHTRGHTWAVGYCLARASRSLSCRWMHRWNKYLRVWRW